ncbi:lanthionine synthetase LanC family protein [Streptomyces sp. NBC_01497]|uniref:lanthionine synthetase LanC family protein n=1 Tax=Streptomyces sp. NBC_01497 TaxID=2903885 RepID=UPI002E3256DC|nr:lanthionine synthetase LanC family protein [Streptomyces sp. NBC_01497]
MDGTRTAQAETLAAGALDWILRVARDTPAITGAGAANGLAWTTRPSDDEPNPMLYNGTSGVLLALLEGWSHFGDDRYADAAVRAARGLADTAEEWDYSSLHFGRAGIAVALNAVGEVLGDASARTAAGRSLDLVRARFDGTRWGDQFELLGGNAGIALGALACGDTDLAVAAAEPYLRTAQATRHGVRWEGHRGRASRLNHISHGTLGVVYALAAVGRAAHRTDLSQLALAGAADVTVRDEGGPDGFLVPHSDPQVSDERVQRFSYGWCHGPTGDAQVFRLLRDTTGDPAWASLADRCWHTVTRSGLPRRLRPGFWDNNGHCCGTAGVLALACDRAVEQGDGIAFADTLATDLLARATADADGVRWSNTEHRATPSTLEPEPGWAMGSAGIIRELLRYARLRGGGDAAYAHPWPDQPAAHPPTRPRPAPVRGPDTSR